MFEIEAQRHGMSSLISSSKTALGNPRPTTIFPQGVGSIDDGSQNLLLLEPNLIKEILLKPNLINPNISGKCMPRGRCLRSVRL
jgi:hypothetical protein